MNYLKSIAILCFFISFAASAQQDFSKKVNIVFTSIKSKSYTDLKSILDKDVKIGNLPRGMNDVVIPQVLNQMPVPAAYVIAKIETEQGGTRVRTVFDYNDKKRNHSFLFDTNGMITEMDILEGATATVMQMNGSPEATEMPDKIIVPFEVHAGLIFTKATVNGQQGNFVLDSGCPALVVNSGRIAAEDMGGTVNARGIGGDIADIKKLRVKSANWGGISLQGFDVMAMNLSHLEEEAGQNIMGLIGFEVFKDYMIAFDYDNKVLTLLKTDDMGHAVHESKGLLATIPFELTGHIPVIKMSVSGKTYNVGIDTGATANLLATEVLANVKGNISALTEDTLIGADKGVKGVSRGEVYKAYIGKAKYKNMTTIFADGTLDQLNAGYNLKLEGLIGYEFLRQYKTVFNYKKKEMYIYKS